MNKKTALMGGYICCTADEGKWEQVRWEGQVMEKMGKRLLQGSREWIQQKPSRQENE